MLLVRANIVPATFQQGLPQVMRSAMSGPGPKASASAAPRPNTSRHWPGACSGVRAKDASKPPAECHSSPIVWIATAVMSSVAAVGASAGCGGGCLVAVDCGE